ncbi:hypothetical protein GJU41_11805 [Bacillus idriensis]|uniref:Uncharacterized protein n=1 Tax=Metabacillus idriensis TaxID=324768 RepID=A0A6I2MBG3_9BACI|nr:hypothetical protein [Metabacillus idriensis]MRX54657.1 hypothetical protein [Metabacillus idriensis]
MNKAIELASAVFTSNGNGGFTVTKSRHGDLIVDAKYSEGFVKQYALMNEDVVIVEKEPDLKVGDYAKVINDGETSVFKKGDFVKITRVNYSIWDYEAESLDGNKGEQFFEREIAKATDQEIAAAKAQAEAKREADRWEKIGRKPGEYKKGDIVRVLGDNPLGSRNKDGDIGEIYKSFGSNYAVRVVARDGDDNGDFHQSDSTELITPVESRFDLAMDGDQDDAK